ncbi:MAG TPA: hypothetical protein VE078_13050, partial [Thermoanaerobaculia bacterium]|nr:hypothetical protein [Thermoanaerobaculia bacterium]
VEAVAHLLDHPGEAIALGKAARERALGTFTLERCAEEYDSIYRKLGSPEGPVAGRGTVRAEGGTLTASPGSGGEPWTVPAG